ncbi:hypothetical protein [Pseudemcibacter aquimaris]|uniref:hypothetical protein n=1 Tax=Pseudemcibacter aquimaris TaxID=2857064 RepID=UPI0020127156|nr:hypothetical protein [Pseudemcibacter aquimaris]MCC3859879.1 hypothetical protein [Pseudemcibacter aquimaris]WDU57211.1 hypothetical protein KW060_08370 [Pseudemcibacter aquimaris]
MATDARIKYKKQPIVFREIPQGELAEGEQMMDLLLHYAQSGIHEVEKIMREEPAFFSDEEVNDFAASKTILGKAPDIINEYKEKLRQFVELGDSIHKVLHQCEDIVADFEERQAHYKPGAKVKKSPRLEAGMIRYTADGEMIVKKEKTVKIELNDK